MITRLTPESFICSLVRSCYVLEASRKPMDLLSNTAAIVNAILVKYLPTEHPIINDRFQNGRRVGEEVKHAMQALRI